MSFRRSTTIGRGLRPAQVFKKRHNLASTQIPINADATLLGEIVMRETGTIYALKISAVGNQIAGTGQDQQRIMLWARCVPAVTGLPDLTSEVEMDTLNGFFVGQFVLIGGQETSASKIEEKFRFRRKCDENSLIQLIGQSTSTNGTGRVVIVDTMMEAVIRMK